MNADPNCHFAICPTPEGCAEGGCMTPSEFTAPAPKPSRWRAFLSGLSNLWFWASQPPQGWRPSP